MDATTATTGSARALTLDDLRAAVKKIEAMPRAQWVLIAPDGRVWASEDPAPIARQLLLNVPFDKLIPTTPPTKEPTS